MPDGPLDDAIAVLEIIKEKYPYLNRPPYNHCRLEFVIKDGVVYSIGPSPYLVRGKNFHVSSRKRGVDKN